MPATKSTRTRTTAKERPLKDPLRAPTARMPSASAASARFDPRQAPDVRIPGPDLRKTEISEFCDWLRTQTNKNKLPYQERAIDCYAETARVLDRWMAENGIDEDFTACDTGVLNRGRRTRPAVPSPRR
jgi:hypothetical protein